MTTGWPPGLLQDDSRKLSDWFASRVDARWTVRQVCAEIERNRMTDKQPEALRLADELLEPMEGFPEPTTLEKNAAALLRTQHKQIAAYKLLTESQEAQLSQHRAQADKFREAIATLQSEREANAILTAAIERKDALLRKLIAALDSDRHDIDDWPPESCEAVYDIRQELSQ